MANIIIFTSYFPYTKMSESFLLPELQNAPYEKSNIILVPVNKSEGKRAIPDGVFVDNSIACLGLLKRLVSFFGIIKYLPYVNFKIKSSKWRWKYIIDCVKYLYASNLVYSNLIKHAKCDNAIFYSYWLSYSPIAFAMYKYKHPDTKHIFIARGHGSDIYGPQVGVYYPLRNFTFERLDKIYVISDYGIHFLQNSYPHLKGKFELSRLGVVDNYVENKQNDDIIRIVSCSSIIPLKRVDLIFQSINSYASNNPSIKLEWIHIGDGSLMDNLQKLVRDNKEKNLTCVLNGCMDNSDILNFYRNSYIHCFVLLSTSEGIPVSIMEAISSGIPVVATNVGGVSEIVNERTGILINVDFSQKDFNSAFDHVIQNNKKLSISAHNFFLENYYAKDNYSKFYKSIDKLIVENR